MKWIIVKDHLSEEMTDLSSRVGTHGASGVPRERSAADAGYWEVGYVCHCRLYDDDGELYYTARVEFDGKDDQYEEGFEPLYWAMYDSGCTIIKYKAPNNGPWEIL